MSIHNVWRKLVFLDEIATLIANATDPNFTNLTNLLAQRAPIDLVDNPQPASWTLTAESPAYLTRMTAATANVLTVPNTSTTTVPALRPILVMRYGAGITTITAAAGVTLLPANNLRLVTQYDWATLMRITANTWVVKGEVAV